MKKIITKSAFHFDVVDGVLCIEDLDLEGGMSVTNDKEEAIKTIKQKLIQ